MRRRIFTRAVALLVLLVLPAWAAALDYAFKPPIDPDDVAAPHIMRDLAQRIVPVYKDADTDVYLANVTALQIVAGAYLAGYDSSRVLRRSYQGKPLTAVVERAIVDGIYANARAIEQREKISFAQAFARSFQDRMQRLDNAVATPVLARMEAPPALYREPVQRAFDNWRDKPSIPQADAVALVRTWLEYESRRSYAPLLPELIAAENRIRYAATADVTIPVRPGVFVHANVVRPGRAAGTLPTLLRFTLDPAEDDAQRSAFKGYVGVTAYVAGRRSDGSGAIWPFEHDGEDAAAVIEWIARQPWSDGRVAMLGEGYSGYTAWAAARLKPPALKAIATIAPMVPGVDFPMSGQIFRNAMVRWAAENARAAPRRTYADDDPEADAKWRALDALFYRSDFPYWDIDLVMLNYQSRLVRTWLTHPSHDRYWQKLLPSDEQYARLDIPVLTIAGYYGSAAGALFLHDEFRRHRSQAGAQADATLLVGPWDDDSIRLGTASTLRGYAPDPVARVDLPELRYQWLDHVFKGTKKPALLQDRANFEVMGANEWRHAAAVDLPGRPPLRLYLQGGRSRDGPHRLVSAASVPDQPSGAAAAKAPARPAAAGVARMQLSVDLADRSDANAQWPDAIRSNQLFSRNSLVFVGDPLPKDMEIAGTLRGELDITPSRQDVDLNVALYEQTANGEYLLLFEPYDFRASYAGHREYRRLLRAGVRQKLPLVVERATARKLAAGSRLVLVIGINKRPDRQINYGSGKDVNSESIADAGAPMRVRWHAGSYVEIGAGTP